MIKNFNQLDRKFFLFYLLIFFLLINHCSILKQARPKLSEEIMLEYEYKKQRDLGYSKEFYYRKNCPELRLCVENCVEIKKKLRGMLKMTSKGIYTQVILPCEIECQDKELCVVYEKY
ncbi:MAG: hypothetical protein MH321_00955 [Leptospiraceae bacterium]|nr:hypothetical protein [Leptospiraceae bacterium]